MWAKMAIVWHFLVVFHDFWAFFEVFSTICDVFLHFRCVFGQKSEKNKNKYTKIVKNPEDTDLSCPRRFQVFPINTLEIKDHTASCSLFF